MQKTLPPSFDNYLPPPALAPFSFILMPTLPHSPFYLFQTYPLSPMPYLLTTLDWLQLQY